MVFIDEDKANYEIINIARKYDLNPVLLRAIVLQRNRGLNNAQIAQHLGIHRNTVNKYVTALEEMNKDDLLKLLAIIAIIGAGAVLFAQILETIFGGGE
jgi:DNA-binding MarR family transcriptional regulator